MDSFSPSEAAVPTEDGPKPAVPMEMMNVDDILACAKPQSTWKRYSVRVAELYEEYWGWELATWLFSLVCFFTIIGLLAVLDGRPRSELPSKVSLNSVTAILFSLVKGSMLLCVTECIGQFRFLGGIKLDALLLDVEAYDAASRGVLGALSLLFKPRTISLSLLGALIMISALAIDPFVQQLVDYPTRDIKVADDPYLLYRDFVNWNEYNFFNFPKPVRDYDEGFYPSERFMHNALELALGELNMRLTHRGFDYYHGKGDPIGPYTNKFKHFCSTGNCTWPDYVSLGTCFSCYNKTSLLQKTCGSDKEPKKMMDQDSTCSFSLPGGHELRTKPDRVSRKMCSQLAAWNNTIIDPGPEIFKSHGLTRPELFTFLAITAFGARYVDGYGENSEMSEAWQCTISLCAQHHRAYYSEGDFYDHVVHEDISPLDCNVHGRSDIKHQGSGLCLLTSKGPRNKNGSEMGPMPLLITHDGLKLLKTALRSRFNRPGTQSSRFRPRGTFMTDGTGPPHVFSLIWTNDSYGLKDAMKTFLRSVDLIIRNELPGAVPLYGTAWFPEVHLKVVWIWLILPSTLLLFTLGFLISTIRATKRCGMKPWKSSSLPLLLDGFDVSESDETVDINQMKSVAKDTSVATLGLWDNLIGKRKLKT